MILDEVCNVYNSQEAPDPKIKIGNKAKRRISDNENRKIFQGRLQGRQRKILPENDGENNASLKLSNV